MWWLYIKVIWGVLNSYWCLNPTPNQLSQNLCGWEVIVTITTIVITISVITISTILIRTPPMDGPPWLRPCALCCTSDSYSCPERPVWSYFTTGESGSERLRWTSSQSWKRWSWNSKQVFSATSVFPVFALSKNLFHYALTSPTSQWILIHFINKLDLLSKNWFMFQTKC